MVCLTGILQEKQKEKDYSNYSLKIIKWVFGLFSRNNNNGLSAGDPPIMKKLTVLVISQK